MPIRPATSMLVRPDHPTIPLRVGERISCNGAPNPQPREIARSAGGADSDRSDEVLVISQGSGRRVHLNAKLAEISVAIVPFEACTRGLVVGTRWNVKQPAMQ